ncbi:glycoside hydrolase family 68 protein [Candidatus Parcubacteria bacterium]|nr:glycoside hydrolase family 68 protein [Candidatus Parcubacteria bacterium]
MNDNYCPVGKCLWDLWFIKARGNWHVFYLQSVRTKDPEDRHNENVSIGHAISKDLKSWVELLPALEPGGIGQWDNLSLWTGSVIQKGKKYYMYYTGRSKEKDIRLIQKIGLAVSNDLINWEKCHENPIIEFEKSYYQMNNKLNTLGKKGAWRDPFVFKDPVSGKYFMTISARKKGSKRKYNSCIALATSENLLKWKVLEPILAPGRYDEMETSQVVYHKGKYYLFFSVSGDQGLYEPDWEKKVGDHGGLHCYYSDNLFRGYSPVNGNGVVLEYEKKIYDVRLLSEKGDEYTSIGWLNEHEDKFIGKMSLPFKIVIKGDRVFKKED